MPNQQIIMYRKQNTITCLVILLLILSSNTYAQTNDKFNDAEVAAIAIAANDIDIKYAEIAKEKSNNEEIIGFANTMIQDHTAVIDKAAELVNELGVKPEPNSLSKKLNSDAEVIKKMLRLKEGKAFDKAYIDNEVEYHKAVIEAIRNILIPNTVNNQLKELLVVVLPALETHLDHAKTLQQRIAEQ